jgi:hypothetical protein
VREGEREEMSHPSVTALFLLCTWWSRVIDAHRVVQGDCTCTSNLAVTSAADPYHVHRTFVFAQHSMIHSLNVHVRSPRCLTSIQLLARARRAPVDDGLAVLSELSFLRMALFNRSISNISIMPRRLSIPIPSCPKCEGMMQGENCV